MLNKIIDQGEKITSLSSHLLAYGQGDDAAQETALLDEVIENALALMSPLYKRDGVIVKAGLEDLPKWHCQAGKLQQLVLSIFINSRQALEVRYPGKTREKRLKVVGRAAEIDGRDGLEIIVTDYGIGIEKGMAHATENGPCQVKAHVLRVSQLVIHAIAKHVQEEHVPYDMPK